MGVGMSWEYGSRTRCPRGRHRVQPSAMHLDCEHDFQSIAREAQTGRHQSSSLRSSNLAPAGGAHPTVAC